MKSPLRAIDGAASESVSCLDDPWEEAMGYKPSVFYFRRALRGTDSPERLREIGLTACAELEQLKAWVRERGLIPPKLYVMTSEAEEKGWECEA